MAKSSQYRKLIGMVLTVVGIGLAIWAYRMSGSFGSQLNAAITGSHGDKVMILSIAVGEKISASVRTEFKSERRNIR